MKECKIQTNFVLCVVHFWEMFLIIYIQDINQPLMYGLAEFM